MVVGPRLPGTLPLCCPSKPKPARTHTLRFIGRAAAREFWSFTRFLKHAGRGHPAPAQPAQAASYLAVGPSQFGPAVQPLLAWRRREFLLARSSIRTLFDIHTPIRTAAIQTPSARCSPEYLLLPGPTTYYYLTKKAPRRPALSDVSGSQTFLAHSTPISQSAIWAALSRICRRRLPVNNAADLGRCRPTHPRTTPPRHPTSPPRAADPRRSAAGNFGADRPTASASRARFFLARELPRRDSSSAPEVTLGAHRGREGGAD